MAFVHGSLARGEEIATSDVDLLVVGRVSLAKLSVALAEAEKRLTREVNPTVYAAAEFASKLAAGNHFLREVLSGPKLLVVGSSDELETLARRAAPAATQDKPRRARRTARTGGSRPPRR
ncbi:MAG: nucleotidyltransferase domain-containing protein [Candidatus Eiseniibacteriota bacterium]